MEVNKGWHRGRADVFWGEIAPCDHILQIYEDDDSFLDMLTGFVTAGIEGKEGVVVIATVSHLHSLKERLIANGIKVPSLIRNGGYMTLDAEETLNKFMVNGWPDESLFNTAVADLLNTAGKGRRKVRVFGEMVALLWAQGNSGATVNLEHLWNSLCSSNVCSVFCAYPKSGFTLDAAESMMHICRSHSKMIAGKDNPASELYYQNIQSS